MPELNVLPPRYWRNVKYYYRLTATQCKRCGRIYYPPRVRCVCGSTELNEVSLIDNLAECTLDKFTVLHSVPVDFEKYKPLGFGLVGVLTHSGSVKLLAALTDFISPDELSDVKEVEPVFRVVKRDGTYGLICYGIKFRPRKTS